MLVTFKNRESFFPWGVTYSTGISRYKPCHGPPMKCTVMDSVTLTLLFGRTAICASNFSMRNSFVYAEATQREKDSDQASHRAVLLRKRRMWRLAFRPWAQRGN